MTKYIANYQETEGLSGRDVISKRGFVLGRVIGTLEGQLMISPLIVTEGDFENFLGEYRSYTQVTPLIQPNEDMLETIPSQREAYWNPENPYIKRERPLSEEQMTRLSREVLRSIRI